MIIYNMIIYDIIIMFLSNFFPALKSPFFALHQVLGGPQPERPILSWRSLA